METINERIIETPVPCMAEQPIGPPLMLAPGVLLTAAETIYVRGWAITGEEAGLALPDGEQLVERPFDILEVAGRALAAHQERYKVE